MMVYDVTIGNVQAEEESERKKRYFGIAHIFIAIAWGASSDSKYRRPGPILWTR